VWLLVRLGLPDLDNKRLADVLEEVHLRQQLRVHAPARHQSPPFARFALPDRSDCTAASRRASAHLRPARRREEAMLRLTRRPAGAAQRRAFRNAGCDAVATRGSQRGVATPRGDGRGVGGAPFDAHVEVLRQLGEAAVEVRVHDLEPVVQVLPQGTSDAAQSHGVAWAGGRGRGRISPGACGRGEPKIRRRCGSGEPSLSKRGAMTTAKSWGRPKWERAWREQA
jgi:hypothetical protein